MANEPAPKPAPPAQISVPELMGRFAALEALTVELGKLQLKGLSTNDRQTHVAAIAAEATAAISQLVHAATRNYAIGAVDALSKRLADAGTA